MVALLAGQTLGALGNHLTGAQPGLQGRNSVSQAGYTTSDQNSEIARAQMSLIWGVMLCSHCFESLNNIILEFMFWKHRPIGQ